MGGFRTPGPMLRRAPGDGHDVLIAFAVARRWTDVLSNALEAGWVAALQLHHRLAVGT